MSSGTFAVLLLAMLICTIAAPAVAASGATTRPDGPVTLRELQDRGIQGQLGVKLGTIVEVAADVVPNTSRKKADSGVPFFLKITNVNGKPLAKPVEYRFAAHPMAKVDEPKIGESFRYVGYESGAFTGSPDGEFKYVPAYPATGFAFQTEFRVLARR